MGENVNPDLFEEARILSNLIRKHRGRIVIYTGAGISTSASIPDYRGTNGLYRNSNSKRKFSSTKLRLLEASFAEPTFSHMAISALVSDGYVRHVVSQNVDCLHLRSGLPLQNLSELHGNLFIEQCLSCKKLTHRAFDVGENTARGRHLTGRICRFCCEASEASSLHRSISQEAFEFLQKKKDHSKQDCVVAFQRAAHKVCRQFSRQESKPAPMLQDVIIHYGERLATDDSVNRMPTAMRAIFGRSILENDFSSGNAASGSSIDLQVCSSSSSSSLSSCTTAVGGGWTDKVNAESSPVSLIIVIGTSLTVLRFYSFLWPRGLGRCLGANTKGNIVAKPAKRTRLNCDSEASTAESPTKANGLSENCELAVINMQSTCKDGLASFVSRQACDDLLRQTVEGCLGLKVPVYDAATDPLREVFLPLSSDEEVTRTRPNIFPL